MPSPCRGPRATFSPLADILYGSFGNVSSVTDTDAGGEARTTSFTYDALDLYPRTTTNAVGHTHTVTTHSGLGVTLDSADANGVVTATWKYDRFGRLREVNHADGWFERYTSTNPRNRFTTVPNGAGGTVTRDEVLVDPLGRPMRRTLFDEHDSTARSGISPGRPSRAEPGATSPTDTGQTGPLRTR